jgi:hypothetical protein
MTRDEVRRTRFPRLGETGACRRVGRGTSGARLGMPGVAGRGGVVTELR